MRHIYHLQVSPAVHAACRDHVKEQHAQEQHAAALSSAPATTFHPLHLDVQHRQALQAIHGVKDEVAGVHGRFLQDHGHELRYSHRRVSDSPWSCCMES